MELSGEIEETELQHILFVPSAYNAYRASTHKTPSSPSRGYRTRMTPGGRMSSRTPPPPPLNDPDTMSIERFVPATFADGVSARFDSGSIAPGRLRDLTPIASDETLGEDDERRDSAHGRWIKICGATEGDIDLILRHFRNFGEIERWDCPSSPTTNWVFIKFDTEEAATMALRSNGTIIKGTRCFGVVRSNDSEEAMLRSKYAPGFLPHRDVRPRLEDFGDGITQGAPLAGPVASRPARSPTTPNPLSPSVPRPTESVFQLFLKYLSG